LIGASVVPLSAFHQYMQISAFHEDTKRHEAHVFFVCHRGFVMIRWC